MTLVRIPFAPETPPLPPRVAEFVAAAAPRIEEFEWGEERVPAFVASNSFMAHDVLHRLRDGIAAGDRFCEWGSGYGTITGIAALLGWRATGIEIEPRLVRESRLLLASHGIEATIVEGSYYAPGTFRGEPDVPALVERLGFAPWDFDVVYIYPWHSEVERLQAQFTQHAPPGSVLVTFHGGSDLRIHRQEPGTG